VLGGKSASLPLDFNRSIALQFLDEFTLRITFSRCIFPTALILVNEMSARQGTYSFETDDTAAEPAVAYVKHESVCEDNKMFDGKAIGGFLGRFDKVIGNLPCSVGNVRPGNEIEDLDHFINGERKKTSGWLKALPAFFVLPGIYYLFKSVLIDKDEWGFAIHNGVVEFLKPGWHLLASAFNHFAGRVHPSQAVVKVGSVSIIRVQQSQIGFASQGSNPEILLPGLHVRNDPAFKFEKFVNVADPQLEYGPIKIVTVQSGSVRLVYDQGKIGMLTEGRYAINSPAFTIGPTVSTQQQNVQFSKHRVLLDGGINLEIQGLLTFQLKDVVKLMRELGSNDMMRALQDVTKGALAQTFAGLHLEQISQGSSSDAQQKRSDEEDEKVPESVLGKPSTGGNLTTKEGETRLQICEQVVHTIRPLVECWGVEIIKFQLENTQIANPQYAAEYEAASLAMAKAKADLRALGAQNKILIQKAEAEAKAVQIQAEGKKNSVIIDAQGKKDATILMAEGQARARVLEAEARNQAAELLQNPFAKEAAMRSLDVDMVTGLKAQNLTLMGGSVVGRALASASQNGSPDNGVNASPVMVVNSH